MTGISTPSWQRLLSTASSNGTPKTGCSSRDENIKRILQAYYIFGYEPNKNLTHSQFIPTFWRNMLLPSSEQK
jgi:hypothetical protein